LKDRVCVVTGSSGGLGKGIAVQFAREGAGAVAVTYAPNRTGAEETDAEVDGILISGV